MQPLKIIFFLILIFGSISAKESIKSYSQKNVKSFQQTTYPQKNKPLSRKAVVEYAKKNLPLKGRLVMNPGGYCYIKVDDNYIHTLLPMLDLPKKGFKKPPFFRRIGAPGAHISVFYEGEKISPSEIGKVYHFSLKKIAIVNVSQDTSFAVIEVECPELEKLRKKYGLSPKLFGHEFHISIGKKAPKQI